MGYAVHARHESGWRGGECGDRGLVTTTLERTRKDKVMLYEKGARSTAPLLLIGVFGRRI